MLQTLVFFLILISLQSSTFAKSVHDTPPVQYKTFEINVHPGLPIYVFRLVLTSLERNPKVYFLDHIEVSKKGNSRILQLIRFHEYAWDVSSDDLKNDPQFFQGEDLNFDSYKDLKIKNYLANGVHCPAFSYYLFDKKLGLFDSNPITLSCSGLDAKNRTISEERRGEAGGAWGRNTYKFINGKLTLIGIEIDTPDKRYDDSNYTRVIQELKNGRMVTVKKERLHNK